MKNVWNGNDNHSDDPRLLDQKLKNGSLVRFTHFPSFRGWVGVYMGSEENFGRLKWKFINGDGVEWIDPSVLTHFRIDLLS